MSRRLLLVYVTIFFVTPCLWSQDNIPRQSQGCSSRDLTALLKLTDPAYAETVELTHELEGHGNVVRCVLQSKMANAFNGQLGAALYRTSRGDFEALFLPKPQTFASIRLTESHKSGDYVYSFQGTPGPPHTMDCARRTFFAKRANRLFVTEDKQLAASLGEILNPN
jgi:hypothetical protein